MMIRSKNKDDPKSGDKATKQANTISYSLATIMKSGGLDGVKAAKVQDKEKAHKAVGKTGATQQKEMEDVIMLSNDMNGDKPVLISGNDKGMKGRTVTGGHVLWSAGGSNTMEDGSDINMMADVDEAKHIVEEKTSGETGEAIENKGK